MPVDKKTLIMNLGGVEKNERRCPRLFLPCEMGDNFYQTGIEKILFELLPNEFFNEINSKDWLEAHLPLIGHSELKSAPSFLSLFLFCRFRANAFRFFSEMCRSLIPGKRLNLFMQYASDFAMPDLGDELYIAGRVTLRFETAADFAFLQNHLPLLEDEMRLGLPSSYRAATILESKGLACDARAALLRETISELLFRRPDLIDSDIFVEMQRFLVLAKEEFKSERSILHLARFITATYLFRRASRLSMEAFPDKQEIYLKIIRERLEGKRRVVGLVVGINFLRDFQVIEKRHLLSAIQSLIPQASFIANSFLSVDSSSSDTTRCFYLEVEDVEGGPFSLDEIRRLKRGFVSALKQRIEMRQNPLFMPENEEEIMRRILALSEEVKFVRDMPQAGIYFQTQKEELLEFLVIIVHPTKEGSSNFSELFSPRSPFLEFYLKKCRPVASMRNGYVKEAAVLLARVQKSLFLRDDQSIDLNRARHEIVLNLKERLGDFRDYNGGILSKESETFSALKKNLGDIGLRETFLLENFFYSIQPTVMRSLLPEKPLRLLFLLLLETQRGVPLDEPFSFQMKEEEDYLFILIQSKESQFRSHFENVLERSTIPTLQIASFSLTLGESPYFGVIARNLTREEKLNLRFALENAIEESLI